MTIEMRGDDCGFVYTPRTRLGFSPLHTVRRELPKSDALILWTASGWPAPTLADVGQCIDQIKRRFPGRAIFADCEGTPVPVHEPPHALGEVTAP